MSRKSSKKKHARRRARESALALLYSGDIIESSADRLVEEGLYPADDINLSNYAESLVKGVCAHREEIDSRLMSTSENWALDRMPVVDRAILRLAVYEMLYVDEVPVSVAINEAVELAKAYGGEDESSRFVNGVLGKIARAIEDAEPSEVAATEAATAEAAVPDVAIPDAAAPEVPAPDAPDASAIDEPAPVEATTETPAEAEKSDVVAASETSEEPGQDEE